MPVAGHRTFHVDERIHLRAEHDDSRRWLQYSRRRKPSADPRVEWILRTTQPIFSYAETSAMFVLLLSLRTRRTTLCTSSSSPFPESVFQHSEQPCEDQRPQQSGLTRMQPLTGYNPNQIAEDQDYRHFTGDGQFTELEDFTCQNFHQSIMGQPMTHRKAS